MDFLTANDRPGEHAPSWYAATAHPFPDQPGLTGDRRADVCVVGGGYAGLSTAYHLARAGLDVALVEAHRAGWGASGRNGGQLGSGPRAEMDVYEKTVGPEDARKCWDIAVAANKLVKDLIAEHAIDCDLKPGYLECAWRPGEEQELAAYADHIAETYDYPHIRAVSKDEMRTRVASDRYHGGFEDLGCAHLHPLNLALGLAQAALDAGAVIYERSPVLRLTEGRVETAEGAVDADWIVLACNGYLDGLEPETAHRIMPLNNYILATEPLGDRADALLPDDMCVCDSKFVLNYYRLSPDKRLLFGGGETYSSTFPADIKSYVRRPMLEVFPQLADVRIDYGWGGTLGISRNRMPVFGRPRKGVLSVSGWSGSGVHMATMGGQIAAEAVQGQLGRWDVMAALPSPGFPGGQTLRPLLLRAAMAWYALRDRL